LSAGNPGETLKENTTELWGPEQFEDLFSLIFLNFPRASKTVKLFKGLTENAVSQKTPAVL